MTSTPTRLLIVETDAEARTFLRRRLTRLGYEVVDVADGATALAQVAQTDFDLALVDLHAQASEAGFELLKSLRERKTRELLPILAVADAAEDANEALALGADDCLVRPLYIGVAHGRMEMLTGRGGAGDHRLAERNVLQLRLESLNEAADRTEAVSAMVSELGHQICAPLNALLGATSVLTRICRTPDLDPIIETIDEASGALDLVIVRALGRADRRSRTPKEKVRVLLADHDPDSRLSMHGLLDATTTEVELVEVSAGLDAALALDSGFFDLIMLNLDTPEALAGVRAIRRAERDNQVRRTPILAFGAQGQAEGQALHAGVDLCMGEPVTPAALLSTLAEALVREAEDVRAVA